MLNFAQIEDELARLRRYEHRKQRHERASKACDSRIRSCRAMIVALLNPPDQDGVASPRERQVLLLLSNSATNRQIAEELSISERAVKFHVSNLLRKYQVKKRSQLIDLLARKIIEV